MLLDDFKPQPDKPRLELDKNKRKSFEPIQRRASDSLKAALEDIEPAKADETTPEPPKDEDKTEEPEMSTKPKKGSKFNPKNWSKKQLIIIISAAIVLLGGLVATYFLVIKDNNPATEDTNQAQTETPVPEQKFYSPLTGQEVSEAQSKLPVTGVMIENSLDARPQSGLDSAGVVFEAIAEGGITRFLALFQDDQPDYIGPVRSVRPYYIDWALGFDAAIAHVGGSPQALSDIKTLGAKDLDQFANAGAYHRISSRSSPHNVYTSLQDLLSLQNSKGYSSSKFTPWERKAAEPVATPNASSIDIDISSAQYNSHYQYDPATNQYKRNEGGVPHIQLDKNGTQSQIKADVVIAIAVGKSLASDGHHTVYSTISSGQALIFQDGTVIGATWKKTAHDAQINFTDSAGNAIKLNPGKTWITAVDVIGRVTYR